MSTHFSAESSQAPSRTHTPFGIDDADLFYCPPPIRFQVTDPNNHVTETCPPSFYDLPPLSQKPERLLIQEAQWQARARAKKMPTVPRPIQPRPRRLPTPPSRPLPLPPTRIYRPRPPSEELRAQEHAQLLGENVRVARRIDEFLREKERLKRRQRRRPLPTVSGRSHHPLSPGGER